MTDAPKSSQRDHLTATTDEGKIELTEEELNRVAGGKGAAGGQLKVEYLKIKFSDVLISG